MFVPQTPVCFRRAGSPDRSSLPEDQASPSYEESGERFLLCRTCGLPVARERDRLEVGGKHAHALFNPAGVLFEVGCFTVAPGCRYEGDFTFEFTWFAGYAWRFAMCRRCASHLGWEYRGAAGGFVGLILTELSGS
jgi:hypothetical protein